MKKSFSHVWERKKGVSNRVWVRICNRTTGRQIIVPERRAVVVRGDHCLERKPCIGRKVSLPFKLGAGDVCFT